MRSRLGLALLLAACGGNPGSGATDGGARDAPSVDAPVTDGGPLDALVLDSATADAPALDAAGTPDAGSDAGCDLDGNGICDGLRIGFWGAPSEGGASMFGALVDPNMQWRVGDTSSGAVSLSDAILFMCDVVVVESMRDDITTPELSALQRFVDAGGGLIVMGGYVAGDNTRAEIASSVGEIFFRDALYSGPVQWTGAHPVSEGLASTFESLGGYALYFDPGSTHPVLATTMPSTGAAQSFVVTAEVRSGRVLVIGDENLTLDRAWGANSRRFWSNAFRWVSHG